MNIIENEFKKKILTQEIKVINILNASNVFNKSVARVLTFKDLREIDTKSFDVVICEKRLFVRSIWKERFIQVYRLLRLCFRHYYSINFYTDSKVKMIDRP